jgi:hypothetical protein
MSLHRLRVGPDNFHTLGGASKNEKSVLYTLTDAGS